jgi:hypothetical protein
MSGFLSFALSSARMQADMPTQSDYLPDITSYLIMSISLNLIAFIWFIYMNRCLLKTDTPQCLDQFGGLVKKIFCLCFPSDNKESSKVANTDTPIPVITDGTKNNSIEKSENSIIPNSVETLKKVTEIEDKTNKCDFCERCSDCEADFKKEKDKGKRKKDIESKLQAINYLAFIIMLIVMVSVILGVFVNLSK